MNMEHIYKELERTLSSSSIHKFTVLVEGDFKEIYEKNYLIAKINSREKTFYTEYKLKGDVILFSRYLKSLGYKSVKSMQEISPSSIMYLDQSALKSMNTL